MSQTAADENGAMDKVFVLPLSFAQQRLWFMDQLLPGHVLFNLNFAIRLRQPLDVAILERSLNEIVRRHETLRTTFAFADDQPVQVIVATRRLTLPIRDLGKCSLEGSRPGNALFLHAGLHIIGKRGYGSLIDENIRKTIGMAVSIRARPEFELLTEPQTNILFYRYIPLRWRTLAKRREFPEVARREINLCNERIQSAQYRAGQTFVSRTTVRATHIGHRGPVVALRAVIANPATTERDIEAVLDDQVRIARHLEQAP
jgi:glutamate/tyrosine decarboxylase-like PLP-dependent enzyme